MAHTKYMRTPNTWVGTSVRMQMSADTHTQACSGHSTSCIVTANADRHMQAYAGTHMHMYAHHECELWVLAESPRSRMHAMCFPTIAQRLRVDAKVKESAGEGFIMPWPSGHGCMLHGATSSIAMHVND